MPSAKDLLHSFGIRPSSQRITMLNYLLEHRDHNSADEIYEGLSRTMPMLSKTTVYNTLRLFREAGIVRTVNIGSNSTCFDADLSHHAHFYCRECHGITDIPVMECDWLQMQQYGGQDAEMEVIYHGICPRCKMHLQ